MAVLNVYVSQPDEEVVAAAERVAGIRRQSLSRFAIDAIREKLRRLGEIDEEGDGDE